MATISLVAGFCLPLYSQYFANTHRLQAQIALTELAAKLEEYYILHHTYQHVSVERLGFSSSPLQKQYEINISLATDSQFLITATPSNSQTDQNTRCGVLTLNESGEKKFTGSGLQSECW